MTIGDFRKRIENFDVAFLIGVFWGRICIFPHGKPMAKIVKNRDSCGLSSQAIAQP